MEKSTMTITITGCGLQGYDTIADLIANTLEEKGISTKTFHCFDAPRCREMRPIASIAENVHVDIITIQAHRRSIFNTQKTDNSVQE